MKRAALFLLGLAVLSAWGMPLHPPCCGFRDSAAPMMASNCCPIEGCPLAQARGAAPASISTSFSPDTIASAATLQPTAVRLSPSPLFDSLFVADSGSCPPRTCPTSELLSVYRI